MLSRIKINLHQTLYIFLPESAGMDRNRLGSTRIHCKNLIISRTITLWNCTSLMIEHGTLQFVSLIFLCIHYQNGEIV